jgi:hypothetical protein
MTTRDLGLTQDWGRRQDWDSAHSYALFHVQIGSSSWDPRLHIKPEIDCEDVACAYAMARVMGMTQGCTFWQWAEETGMAERVKE